MDGVKCACKTTKRPHSSPAICCLPHEPFTSAGRRPPPAPSPRRPLSNSGRPSLTAQRHLPDRSLHAARRAHLSLPPFAIFSSFDSRSQLLSYSLAAARDPLISAVGHDRSRSLPPPRTKASPPDPRICTCTRECPRGRASPSECLVRGSDPRAPSVGAVLGVLDVKSRQSVYAQIFLLIGICRSAWAIPRGGDRAPAPVEHAPRACRRRYMATCIALHLSELSATPWYWEATPL